LAYLAHQTVTISQKYAQESKRGFGPKQPRGKQDDLRRVVYHISVFILFLWPWRCHSREFTKAQKTNGNKEKAMISTTRYIGVIDDCAAGTVGSFELPRNMNSADIIGARVKVKLNDENGMPIIKSGKLIEILEEWS
jgi:hypothetical protein